MNKMPTLPQPKATSEVASLSEQEIKRVFMERDRFGDFKKCALYEEVLDRQTGQKQGLIHITNPYEQDGVVVTLPTQASREDVEAIVSKISATPEFCAMLSKMAECYELGYPVILEGGTAVGKTFMVNKFTELLYGKGVQPLDFYCNGQTDVSDLIGKWVPREGSNPEVQEKWEAFLNSPQGQARLQQIDEGIANTGPQVSPEDKAKMYQAQMRQLAVEAGLGNTSEFVFQLGAIPKAFIGEYKDGRFHVPPEGGEGFIVHIQEVGLAKPAVINALLRIRGAQGGLAESLQLWEDSGRVIGRGPKTFVVFTNNPVDGYLDRKPLDPALARALEWFRFGEGLSEQSVAMTSRAIFSYSLGNGGASGPSQVGAEPLTAAASAPVGVLSDRQTFADNRHARFNFKAAPEVTDAIASAMVAIHQTLANHFNSAGQDDPQMTPVVMDNMFKVAAMIQNHQVKVNGEVDVGKTLMRAIRRTYLERAPEDVRGELITLIEDRIFGDSGKEMLDGKLMTFAERMNLLAKRSQQASSKEPSAVEQAVEEGSSEAFFGGLKDLLG